MVDFLAANLLLVVLVLGAGFAAGFAGGLFGIGGGIIVVPVLYAVFQTLGIPETESLKTAIGTSLGVIIITSFRSLMTHHKAGQVDVSLLRAWAPWIAIGAGVGGLLARWAPLELLTIMFAVGAGFIAWKRIVGGNKKTPNRNLMRGAIKVPFGFGAGLFSSLMGLGGGAVGVMVMTASGRAIHQAVATSAGFGMAVAIPGVSGFIFSGWGAPALPAGSVGFLNLPAFFALAAMAAIAAPLGARLAHRTDGDLLSRMFGVYVAIAATGLVIDVFA